MCDNANVHIFQSGQKVVTSGKYDAVGTHDATQRYFHTGEVFPDLNGRAICWHLIEALSTDQLPAETKSVPQHTGLMLNY